VLSEGEAGVVIKTDKVRPGEGSKKSVFVQTSLIKQNEKFVSSMFTREMNIFLQK